MKYPFSILAFLLILSRQVQAELMYASSIEWLACKSEIIIVGKVKRVTTEDSNSMNYEEATVELDEVIKGNVKEKQFGFSLRKYSPKTSLQDLMNSAEQVLIMLKRSTDYGPNDFLYNKYVPTSMQSPLSIMSFSEPKSEVYSKEMRILSDKKEILDSVRTWAKCKVARSVTKEVRPDSPIYERLYSGSACFLLVPAEEKHRVEFLTLAKSDKPEERLRGAHGLSLFPGHEEETERVLRELLNDKTERVSLYSEDTIAKIDFYIRASAYRKLQELGKSVPDIELERQPSDEQRRSLRAGNWERSFAGALTGGWKVLSVEDGKTRLINGRDTTSVIVNCEEGNSKARFLLIPKEWDKKDLPSATYLGISRWDSQGAKHFFLEGVLPNEVQDKLVKYYNLVIR
jgi:hypothetical protein